MKYTLIFSILVIVMIILSRPAAAADSWQEKMLFNPTPAQLDVEKCHDRIMIYSGLKDVQVARAMEEQFDRIEHMMFTGTVVTDDHGEPVIDAETGKKKVEDDGC